MRLRYTATDGGTDNVVEAAVDEVHISGMWVDCQAYTPPLLRAPNPVGNSLRLAKDAGGHAVLTWDAPPVDAGHDAATLYRITRAIAPQGPWTEVGSATSARWVDVDALRARDAYYYRVTVQCGVCCSHELLHQSRALLFKQITTLTRQCNLRLV